MSHMVVLHAAVSCWCNALAFICAKLPNGVSYKMLKDDILWLLYFLSHYCIVKKCLFKYLYYGDENGARRIATHHTVYQESSCLNLYHFLFSLT